MATVTAYAGQQPSPANVGGTTTFSNTGSLSAAQTGNGASTNVVDRGGAVNRPALLKITTTVGATPTCTYAIEGSPDGVNFFQVAYEDSTAPGTLSSATFTITTATTVWKILPVDRPWRYLRITYSSNTNVTNTADLWVF